MTLSDLDRAAVQKRTLSVLFLGTIGARAANTLIFTVASLAILDMVSTTKLAGLGAGAATLGTALSSRVLSTYMAGRGRRPGLVLGFSVAVVGVIFIIVGVQQGSLMPFLFGLTLFGVGQGSANLARYAAADLAEPSSRAKSISLIVFASTIGAVGGPLIVGPAEGLARSWGRAETLGPFVFAALCLVAAATIFHLGLRPDPLVASGGLNSQATGPTPRSSLLQSLETVRTSPLSTLALVAMVTSQLVMVMVMVMTPAHMQFHDQKEAVGWVIAIHTFGMFMFAPLAGWVSDRFGRVQTIMQGAAILAIATVVTALAGEAPKVLLFPGLFLLGLGWSFAMVSASALLTEPLQEEDRVGVQGTADLLTSGVSGLAAIGAGFIFDMTGYHVLSLVGTTASGLLLVASFVVHRTNKARKSPLGP